MYYSTYGVGSRANEFKLFDIGGETIFLHKILNNKHRWKDENWKVLISFIMCLWLSSGSQYIHFSCLLISNMKKGV